MTMLDAMKRLRQLREEQGFTQEHVAHATGVLGKQVSLWESAKNVIPGDKLAAYIKLVQASSDEIIGLIMKDQPDVHLLLVGRLQASGGAEKIKRAAARRLKKP